MTHAEAADAMQRSPGGTVRVLFDPRTQSASEIAALMNAIRSQVRHAAGLPEDSEPGAMEGGRNMGNPVNQLDLSGDRVAKEPDKALVPASGDES